MKTYKQYVNEEVMPFAQTDKNFIGVESEAVRDNINDLLDGVTNKGFVTPYNALERVSKVLAYAHIYLPKYTFSEGDHGATAFQVNQFGLKAGMTNNGEFVKNVPAQYFVYFEYHKGDNGLYDVFACLCDKDELDELISDYEDDTDNNFDNRFVDDLTPQEQSYQRNAEEHVGQLYEAPRMVTDPANKQSQVIPEIASYAAKKATKRAFDKKKDLSENYHDTYSGAIKAAVDAAKKRGYEVDPEDYDNKVASGPRKPSEGKTVSHNLKLTKDGKPTKKGLAIQVYNKGGKTPYELNHYISEAKDDSTMPAWYQKEKAKSLTLQAMTAAKKKQQGKKIKQAIRLTKEETLDEGYHVSKIIDQKHASMHDVRLGGKRVGWIEHYKPTGIHTAHYGEKKDTPSPLDFTKKKKFKSHEDAVKAITSYKTKNVPGMYGGVKEETLDELSDKTKRAYVKAATKDKAELNKQITKDTFSKSPYHDSESSRLKDLALGHKLVANRTKGIERASKGLKENDSNPPFTPDKKLAHPDAKNKNIAKKLARQAAKKMMDKKKD